MPGTLRSSLLTSNCPDLVYTLLKADPADILTSTEVVTMGDDDTVVLTPEEKEDVLNEAPEEEQQEEEES